MEHGASRGSPEDQSSKPDVTNARDSHDLFPKTQGDYQGQLAWIGFSTVGVVPEAGQAMMGQPNVHSTRFRD